MNTIPIRWNDVDDLTLRCLLTSLDQETAEAAETERQVRLRNAGGAPKLEAQHEEKPDR